MREKRGDYQGALERAWVDHLTPRGPGAPTVVSLFAGCGGSSLGYSMAGYRELLAVELDADAVRTFKLNFPGVPVYHGDITELSAEECAGLAGVGPGELDVLDGSPPCQGFSTAGSRKMADLRNSLFKEYVRLLRALMPRAFVMENVSGMVKGVMKLVFAEAVRELKASGYKVSARLVNAMWFHVPQSRERMIFIGVREDVEARPSHPRAEWKPISVREAISQDGVQIYRCSYGRGFTHVKSVLFQDAPCQTLRVVTAGGQALVSSAEETDICADQPAPPLSPLYLEYWRQAQLGRAVGPFNSNRKLALGKPSHTLGGSEGYRGAYHPTEPRGLSTGERKRLASFPASFQFADWASAVRQIGNSVLPFFMRAIAGHVRQEILGRIRKESPSGHDSERAA